MMTKEAAVTRQIIGSDENDIRCGLRALQTCVHALAVDKGWYDPAKSIPESIAMMHSELSEALEAYRAHGERYAPGAWEDGDKPEGFAIELADCVIRILDTCEHLGIDLADAILKKHAYNRTRSHRHGGKAI